MRLKDKLFRHRAKKALRKWGLDKVEIDFSELTPEDWEKLAHKLQEFIKKHPSLKKLKLDSLPVLLRHKDELQRIFEENKEEIEKILKETRKK